MNDDAALRRRRATFACLRTLIDTRFGGTIMKRYLAELVVARRS